MALFEQHYPEFLTRFIVINAPAVFSALFAIVKPLMRKDTRKKNILLGSKSTFITLNSLNEVTHESFVFERSWIIFMYLSIALTKRYKVPLKITWRCEMIINLLSIMPFQYLFSLFFSKLQGRIIKMGAGRDIARSLWGNSEGHWRGSLVSKQGRGFWTIIIPC